MLSRYSKRLYLNIAAQDTSIYRYSSKENRNEDLNVLQRNQLHTVEKNQPYKHIRKLVYYGGTKSFSTKQSPTFRSLSSLSSEGSGNEFKTEKALFKLYMNPATEKINMGHFLLALEKTGLRRSDPRLQELTDALEELHSKIGEEGTTPDNIDLPFESFQRLIEQNLVLISQAFSHKLIIPDFLDFCTHVKDIYRRCKNNKKGEVANYIPQLATAKKERWAMSVCTVDGQRYSLGDVKVPFTLQSVSKPFTYAICLNELGPEIVHNYISHEPSGRNFNSIGLDKRNKPHNPMLNSGAIISSSLLLEELKKEMSLAEKFDYVMNYIKRIGGGEFVGFNNAVYLSERETADRNFAMGYYMKENKCFPTQERHVLQKSMELYFQSCSIEVNTETLAVMGATLANGGICPTTGEKVLHSSNCIRNVLSLMFSCGMYNYSGEFAFNVGLPAKSGVSGGLILVIPNLMGIGLWSPPLDEIGNSSRCLQFCEELVERFNFHHFDNLNHAERKIDPRRSRHEKTGLSTVTMLFAAKAGDMTAIKRLHMQGADMDSADYDGRTTLHVAAAEGHFELVKFLIEVVQVNPEPQDRWGFTPHQESVRFGHSRISDFFIQYLNHKDDSNDLEP